MKISKETEKFVKETLKMRGKSKEELVKELEEKHQMAFFERQTYCFIFNKDKVTENVCCIHKSKKTIEFESPVTLKQLKLITRIYEVILDEQKTRSD